MFWICKLILTSQNQATWVQSYTAANKAKIKSSVCLWIFTQKPGKMCWWDSLSLFCIRKWSAIIFFLWWVNILSSHDCSLPQFCWWCSLSMKEVAEQFLFLFWLLTFWLLTLREHHGCCVICILPYLHIIWGLTCG